MAQQTINVGTTANDGTGDPLRTALTKANANFTELYGGIYAVPVQTPAGTVSAPGLQVGDADTGFFQTSGKISLALDGVEYWRQTSTGFSFWAGDAVYALHLRKTGSTAAQFAIEAESGAPQVRLSKFDTSAAAAFINFLKARGTIASPSVIASADTCGTMNFQAYNGSGYTVVGDFLCAVVAGTPSGSDMEARFTWRLCPAGSVTESEVMAVRHSIGLSLFGTQVINENRIFRARVYTVATLPSASTSGNGAIAHVSDALAPTFGATVVGGGAVSMPVYSDATNWKVG